MTSNEETSPGSNPGLAHDNGPFLAPIGIVSRRASTSKKGETEARALLLVELPAELLYKILNYMSFKEISHLRMVSLVLL